MTNVSKISSLRSKRDNLLDRFKIVSNCIDEYQKSDKHDVSLLKTYRREIDDVLNCFTIVEEELDLDGKEHAYLADALRKYCSLIARLNKLIDSVPPSPPMSIELPVLTLPTFDGTIEKWYSFYNTFSAIIGRHSQLTPAQKLLYLRSTLTGEAANCIQSLRITDASYAEAIAILKDRFDYPRYVCLFHWNAIENYPKLTKETPEALEDLVNTVKQHLAALESLGEPVTSNVVIIKVVTSKLSPDIIREWKLTLPNKNVPPYTHLLDFLDKWAMVTTMTTMATQASKQHRPLRESAPQDHASTASHSPSTCPICCQSHAIWNCDIFKAKPIEERRAAAKKASVCINCLKEGHERRHCLAGSCRLCGQRHNTLLHQLKLGPLQTIEHSFSIPGH